MASRHVEHETFHYLAAVYKKRDVSSRFFPLLSPRGGSRARIRAAFSASLNEALAATNDRKLRARYVPDTLCRSCPIHGALKSHARKARGSCITVRPCADRRTVTSSVNSSRSLHRSSLDVFHAVLLAISGFSDVRRRRRREYPW